ncbi:adult-specific rigid cuticular protein 15.7 [Galendromus occidentalis]|uniref:Adult-specific rigid cuticular protein 15.7 n=1 Tax=Galendromus occidentalis TaxID=34638 RepID=A0AAJ7SJG9_9ACAR|nr:adult-specific rigid cuticular protein 15.7 [Galendromus occidentalis]
MFRLAALAVLCCSAVRAQVVTSVQAPPSQIVQVAAQPVHVVQSAPIVQRVIQTAPVVVAAAAPVVEPAYPPQPYHFSYTTVTEEGAHSHEETSDAANRRQGSYSLSIADGRQRIVRYVADENGFRAAIETNELGTESNSPAAVQIVSTAPTGPEAAIQAEAYLSRTITGFPYYRRASSKA